MAATLLFGCFLLLLLTGVPVAFALLGASLTTLLYIGMPALVLVQQTVSGASAASLIAIPLFIFAGEIMLRGGLGQVSVLSSLFFGGVSGSAIADV